MSGEATAAAGGYDVRLVKAIERLESATDAAPRTWCVGFLWGDAAGCKVDRSQLSGPYGIAVDVEVIDNFPEHRALGGEVQSPAYNFRLHERLLQDLQDPGESEGRVLYRDRVIGRVLGQRGRVLELEFDGLPAGLTWPEGETPNTGWWAAPDATAPLPRCSRCGLDLAPEHVCPPRVSHRCGHCGADVGEDPLAHVCGPAGFDGLQQHTRC